MNGSRWNEQVVLKEPKNNVSLNEEIKNKFSVVVPMQQRLEKKIGKDSLLFLAYGFCDVVLNLHFRV